MLSKREKLLVKPWQQRRYDNHRGKVRSALPVIDNTPPPTQVHILVKQKKRQQEIERVAKIEKDNLTLLRKLSHIMKTNRVDNYWVTPPPNFLNRVALYQHRQPKQITNIEHIPVKTINHIRKSKCSACTPKVQIPQNIPEERVPWEPVKPPVSRKRSQSVPARRRLSTIAEKEKEDVKPFLQKTSIRSKSCKANQKFAAGSDDCLQSPRSVLLARGSLKLIINFPSDTSVTVRDGLSQRSLFGASFRYGFRKVEFEEIGPLEILGHIYQYKKYVVREPVFSTFMEAAN